MALSSATLSAAMRSAMLATPAIGAVDGPALTALCDAIASTVVSHITSAGTVLPGTLAAPPGTAGGPIVGVGVIA